MSARAYQGETGIDLQIGYRPLTIDQRVQPVGDGRGDAFHGLARNAFSERPEGIGDAFPPTHDGIIVSLAIPPRKPNGFNCLVDQNGTVPAPRNGADPRFLAESRALHDENTGADERPVSLGRKNIRLLFDTEPGTGILKLPVARTQPP